RGETVKRSAGVEGAQPPCGGLEAAPPGPRAEVRRIPPRTSVVGQLCGSREWRFAAFLRGLPLSVGVRGPTDAVCLDPIPRTSVVGQLRRAARAAASDVSGLKPARPPTPRPRSRTAPDTSGDRP